MEEFNINFKDHYSLCLNLIKINEIHININKLINYLLKNLLKTHFANHTYFN